MSRQSLPRLLGELQKSGVAAASFHPDGRLATVQFAFPVAPGVDDDKPDAAEPPLTSATRRHLAALRGQLPRDTTS